MFAFSGPAHHFYPLLLAVAGTMIIQGLYSAGYARGWWSQRGRLASGALLAGQLISGCCGVWMLYYGVFINIRASNGGIEPAPILAALMIGANSLLALLLLFSSGALTPKTRARAAA